MKILEVFSLLCKMEIITIYVKTDIQNLNISFSAIMIVTLLCRNFIFHHLLVDSK